MKHILIKSVSFAFIITILWPQAALAYIDPNSGGMLFQLLAVVFTFFSGIILFFSAQIRQAFARSKRFFRERLGRSEQQAGDMEPE